jgi:hypothetical protein
MKRWFDRVVPSGDNVVFYHYACAALCVVSGVLYFGALGHKALWNDEAFSFFVALPGFSGALELIAQDTQPPVYYGFLSQWLALGHSPYMVRALSASAMLGAVPLVCWSCRILFDRPTALLATLFFVFDPNCLNWAQKARPYGLQTFFAALAFWGFTKIFATEQSKRGRLPWVAYILGAGLAVLTQYPAAFMLVGLNLVVFFRFLVWERKERLFIGRWIFAQFGVFAVIGLWAGGLTIQFAEHLSPEKIQARHVGFLISGDGLIHSLTDLLSIPTIYRLQWVFAAAFLCVALTGLLRLSRPGPGLAVLGGFLIPLLICCIGWALISPAMGYVTNRAIWFLVPYVMLLAVGVLALPMLPRLALVGLILLGDAWGIKNYEQTPNPPLDQVAAVIAAAKRAGDGVVLSTSEATRFGLAYYLGEPYAGQLNGLDVRDAVQGAPELQAKWAIMTPEQANLYRRLWVVLPKGELLQVPIDSVSQSRSLVSEAHLGNIAVSLFAR